jgi:catechol 2,3-dioxygenase-like lactoylglutathione lyase family enzyme
MSNTGIRFDHIHIIATNPKSTADWYVETLGATLKADTIARGAPQIFLELGGANLVIRGKRPGENPSDSRPIEPFDDFSSHNEWGTDHFGFTYDGDLKSYCDQLAAKGVQFPVPLKQGVGGKWLCYISAPDNVSIELMQL